LRGARLILLRQRPPAHKGGLIMPYNNGQQSPNMPPQGEKPGKGFYELLDCISTDLFIGAAWHLRAANQLRKMGLRGFARLHEYGSCHDHKKRLCLEKLVCDRLHYAPKIDVSDAEHVTSFVLSDPGKLKPHLEMWRDNEREFAKYLAEAVKLAAGEDMCVYNELVCILDGVQDEVFRIETLLKRLELGGWSGHDLATISRQLHIHFEHHPEKGLDIDV